MEFEGKKNPLDSLGEKNKSFIKKIRCSFDFELEIPV